MEEVKEPRSTLEIGVTVDTDEAEIKLERLKKATEGCTKAFEELGDAITSFGTLIQVPDGKEIAKSVEKELDQLAKYRAHTNS
ncbi:hypothetical protein [Bacillus cereus]|uniref:Uncharacterized protein n=1 Tax=Bacillus cereus MC67 TaxID=1053219 RepID=J8EMU6_BACCE|nr:hypothetical protein [Bacillus cereus]EJQ90049.1 hypothetical protein II3_05734 [Bacillus cereus MC67]EOP10433.1 hypothetical protein II1_03904 [Bacillus cereus MC118]